MTSANVSVEIVDLVARVSVTQSFFNAVRKENGREIEKEKREGEKDKRKR